MKIIMLELHANEFWIWGMFRVIRDQLLKGFWCIDIKNA